MSHQRNANAWANSATTQHNEFTAEMIAALRKGRATLIAQPDVIAKLQHAPEFAGINMRGVKEHPPNMISAVMNDVDT